MDIQFAKYKELIEQQLEELTAEDVLGQSAQKTVEVPLEAIDQLGGWSSVSNIGSRYGQGYSVEHLRRYIDRIAIK